MKKNEELQQRCELFLFVCLFGFCFCFKVGTEKYVLGPLGCRRLKRAKKTPLNRKLVSEASVASITLPYSPGSHCVVCSQLLIGE